MKKVLRPILILALVFGLIALVFNLGIEHIRNDGVEGRTVAVNRINAELSRDIAPEKSIEENQKTWEKTFGKDAPDLIEFLSTETSTNESPFPAVG